MEMYPAAHFSNFIYPLLERLDPCVTPDVYLKKANFKVVDIEDLTSDSEVDSEVDEGTESSEETESSEGIESTDGIESNVGTEGTATTETTDEDSNKRSRESTMKKTVKRRRKEGYEATNTINGETYVVIPIRHRHFVTESQPRRKSGRERRHKTLYDWDPYLSSPDDVRRWPVASPETPRGLFYINEKDQNLINMYLYSKEDPCRVLKRMGHAELAYGDLQTLRPRERVVSVIIDSFLHLVCQRSKEQEYPKLPSCYAMPHMFSVDFKKARYDYTDEIRKKYLEDVNLFDYDIVFFPIFLAGKKHFTLIIVDFRTYKMSYYDSLGYPFTILMARIFKLLKILHKEKMRKRLPFVNIWRKENLDGPLQGRLTNNCAVFLCRIADFISRDEEGGDITRIKYVTEQNMWYFRKRLVLELVTGQIIIP